MQALSLKATPDKARSEGIQTSPSLQSVRSSLPQLNGEKQVHQGQSKPAGSPSREPSASGQSPSKRLDALDGDSKRQGVLEPRHDKVAAALKQVKAAKQNAAAQQKDELLSQSDQPAAAAASAQDQHEQQSHHGDSPSKADHHKLASAKQGTGHQEWDSLALKKRKDRKHKKKKRKGSKDDTQPAEDSSTLEGSSARQQSSAMTGPSQRGRILSVQPGTSAAGGAAAAAEAGQPPRALASARLPTHSEAMEVLDAQVPVSQ